ncbi:hypothetical protein [Allorhizocola rhizosphaerae]|nr:hypothetical protein [Allorhizocola rhizosphaerae]
MLNYPEAVIEMAHQRQRELIDEAKRYRLGSKMRKERKASAR